MESSSLETVGIEYIHGSQNRGDENEYFISSVFEDSSELETALETHGGQSHLTSGISANINSRQPQDVTAGPPFPLRTSIRGRGHSPAVETEGASAVTSNRNHGAAQFYDSSLYPSASLDDVCAVPNSVTCIPEQGESSKEGCGVGQGTEDTESERNATAKCSVTINFRITEEHFCCSSRESSLHLELEIGNFDGTRNRNAFHPQVSRQEQTRQTARDGVLRVTSTLVTGSRATREEIVDLHRPPRSGTSTGMDDSDDFQGSSTLDGAETPEYSPTDSESSETSDEVDTLESDKQTSHSHTGLDSHFERPTSEESYVVRSEGVVSEKNESSCTELVEGKSDTQQSDSNEQQSAEENTAGLDKEGEEKCEQDSKEDADRNSMRSGISLVSEDSSKTSVVCNTALNKIVSDMYSVPEDCGNQTTVTEENLDEEGADENFQKSCKEEEKVESGSALKTSLNKDSNSSDVRSENVEDERVLSTEILSSLEEQDLTLNLKDDVSTIEGKNVTTKELDDMPKAELVETPRDSETQGQGDTSHSHTDDTSSACSEITEGTKIEHSLSNGEESKLKLPKTLEHVSEVPRGIFESILYKLYNRMNQRSPRAWRDISRGPCVKQLVKEFSKEAMECPKFPKSQSLHVKKTQEEIPKTQLLESSSDMDDSSKSQSARAQRTEEEIRKSPLFESLSDIDDRGFESRLETSTDDDHLSSDDVPIRSSTPSQEVVVLEIRDELQKPDCSSTRVLQLIKKFGGKGSFKKHKKSEDKGKTEELGEEQLQTKDVAEGNANKDVTPDDKNKSETLGDKESGCAKKESAAWLTNVSVKNLVSIFSEISTSPVLSRRSASRSSKKSCTWQSKDTITKASRTMETQTPGSEPIGSCSNVLLLVQPEFAGNNMLGSRFERKRSTLSVCLPATADLEECDAEGGDPLRACASATGVLLVSTAEPVRVRALCSPDDNRTALTQLAHLLHMPERKAPQARARSVARDSSLVRQMVAQWDRSAST